MSIYTKTGDDGTTSLVGGTRVPKYDSRLEAYGTVDELSAFVALLRDSMAERNVNSNVLKSEIAILLIVLDRLMVVEALLAAESETVKMLPSISEEDIAVLEKEIDEMSRYLPKISKFTLPGGDTLVSKAHICRTVCRRAERISIKASTEGDINKNALKYLNRLSDYFYMLSRLLSVETGAAEILWEPKK